MAFKFRCVNCGRKLEAEDGMVGLEIECPACGVVIVVPAEEPLKTFKEPDKKIRRNGSPVRRGGAHDGLDDRKKGAFLGVRGKKSRASLRIVIFAALFLVPLAVFVFFLKWEGTIDYSKHKVIPPLGKGLNCVVFEAEDAEKVEPSFRIEFDGECSGGKCLSLLEDNGSGWVMRKENEKEISCAIGNAVYSFEIPEDGDYVLWGRALWETGCSNAAFAVVDGAAPKKRKTFGSMANLAKTFGKDETFDTWHWTATQIFPLSKGRHKLRIENQDDGIKIDKFLLTDDPNFTPSGIAPQFFAGDFESGTAGGWRIGEGDWKVMKQGGGSQRLTKISDQKSPAILENSYSGKDYYFSAKLSGGPFSLYLYPSGGKGVMKLDIGNGRYGLKRLSGSMGKSTGGGAANFADGSTFELFRNGGRLVFAIDARKIHECDSISEFERIGIDIHKGGGIDDVRLRGIERIHLGCSFYLAWVLDLNVELGEWRTPENALAPTKPGKNIISAGESWWKDYQICAMTSLPASGSGGILLCYRDQGNHYYVEIGPTAQSLYRTLGGKRTKIAESYVNLEVPGSNKGASRVFHRVTVNRFGGLIQVYIDGKKAMEVADTTFYSGKAGFFSEDAVGLAFDDIEIWSLDKADEKNENEAVVWLKKHRCRIISSVLDDFGATGAMHPGDAKLNRTEKDLSALQKEITGVATKRDKADILDFQWITFDGNHLSEKRGYGREPGYLTFDSGEAALMWSNQLLFGDWDMNFIVKGKCDALSVNFLDVNGGGAAPDGRIAKCEFGKIESAISEKDGATVWSQARMERRGNKITYGLAGQPKSETIFDENALLRPFFKFAGGSLIIDEIDCFAKPSLHYDFLYSQAYRLAMSDWTPRNDKPGFCGGYYSYARIKNSEKQGALKSKRFFKGDFLAVTVMNMMMVEGFSVAIRDKGGKIPEQRFQMTKAGIEHFSGSKKLSSSELFSFSTETRVFNVVVLRIRDGKAVIYSNDDFGTMRKMIEVESVIPAEEAFSLKFEGVPELQLHKVMIWGNEVE
jgi:DNA-directed RNA polymerase subunit RPC12/RpoP